ERPSPFAFLRERTAEAVVVVAWAAVNGALFAHARATYAALGATPWVQIARGFGACLNFDGALVLVPVLRRFWTWARHTNLGRLAPVDAARDFHRLVGNVLFGFALLHAGAHVTNVVTLGLTDSLWERFYTQKAWFTGGVLLAIFAAMWAF